jgi:hypothetical protein
VKCDDRCSPLCRAPGICPATLHERHGPVLELNRVAKEESSATRLLGKKIPEILLRLVGFGDLVLQ